MAGPHHIPRVSDSVDLKWSLGISSSHKFPYGADAPGQELILRITALGNERSKTCDQIYVLERSLWAVWGIVCNGTRLEALR